MLMCEKKTKNRVVVHGLFRQRGCFVPSGIFQSPMIGFVILYLDYGKGIVVGLEDCT